EIHPHEGLTGYWYLILPEYEEMVFLLRYLRSGDIFYDVGANAGAFSVLALAQGCSVIGFEPVPKAFQRLQRNAEINRRSDPIIALNSAVGSTRGSLRMTTGLGTGNHVIQPGENAPSVEVQVVTLDEIMTQQKPPTFIKIDVEGHELEVLRGAIETMASENLHGFLIETFRPHNFGQPKLQALEQLLKNKGFLPYDFDPVTNQLLRLDRPEAGGNNTFYLRSLSEIEKRLAQASS
ncbi:FkbM family methyltransferase, partial [Methylacidiphilales bacterium]|nr:FkbM family methyltransferase [Candidatus Methylacidiphilales bacterium]